MNALLDYELPGRTSLRDKLLLGMTPREYLRSLCTLGNAVAAAILCVGGAVTVLRFTQGLDLVTNLDNDYPWGLWIGFDVVCGVALAAGGFCLAATVHIFHLRQYEAIVRPAVLTGFLGYFFVAVGLLYDLGRPWRLPYPIFVSHGTSSVMFEVAWCVALYLTVLFLECCPAFFEWLDWRRMRRWWMRLTFVLAILGVVLSTLHQSALGGLFLIAPAKLHPLWYSAYIPVFFLISAMAAGISMVIFEGWLSHRVFSDRVAPSSHDEFERLTLGLAKAAAIVLLTYFCLKWIGVIHDNRWAYLATGYGAWFLVELLGFVLGPAVAFVVSVKRGNVALARVAAVWAVLGVVLNRLNISLFAFNWELPYRYVPHWMEVTITVTLITAGLMTFRFVVNRMPILDAGSPPMPGPARGPLPQLQGRQAVTRSARAHARRLSLLAVLGPAILALGASAAYAEDSAQADAAASPASCITCHACDAPSREAPCLKPCPDPEGAAPASAGAAIPNVLLLDILSEHYRGVLFNHARHADMSALDGGCATCHHYSPEDRFPACRACHGVTADTEHLRQPGLRGAYHRQCLSCHRDWSHETGCDNCHAPAGSAPVLEAPKDETDIVGLLHPPIAAEPTYLYEAPDADSTRVTFHHADHVDVFGLRCVDCHAQESCRNCHDAGGPRPRTRQESHEDCIACHEKQTDEDCTFCHQAEERPRFEHKSRTGFDLTPYHGALACATCHRAPAVFGGLEPACVSCHPPEWRPETFDHTSTGFDLDETHREIDCIGCHVEGLGPRAQCNVCHEEVYGPEKSPEAATETLDDEEEVTAQDK